MLKFAIEEVLGYPVLMVSDGLTEAIVSTLNLTGPESVYFALADGKVDMYPEVCRSWGTGVGAGVSCVSVRACACV